MSSRIVPRQESGKVEPIRWPAAEAGASELPDSSSLSELRACYVADESGEFSGSEPLAEHRARVEAFQNELARQVEDARRAGYAEAEQRQNSKQDEMFSRLAAAIEEIAGYRKRFRQQAEEDLVQLAFAISRRVLRRELSSDPEAILGLVRTALDKLAASEFTRVRVHPADAGTVRQHLERLRPASQIEVMADAALAPGGVLFETPKGTLDASVETQLSEIERGFTDILHRRQ